MFYLNLSFMEFFSSLTAHDIFTVLALALLEGILSVDNALVLAILVRPLPENLRKRALKWGIVGAFVFRLLAIIFATFLVKFVFFKLLGGIYLIYLAVKHMFFGLMGDYHSEKKVFSAAAFWKIVLLVELTDIVFSIDSIATAVAFSDKVWVLWFGGIMGIILMRFLSGFFVKLIEKFPKTEDLAYQLVFFVGVKLSFETLGVHIEKEIFWLMMAIIMTIGISLIIRDHKLHKISKSKSKEMIAKLDSGELKLDDILGHSNIDGEVLSWLFEKGYLKNIKAD